MDAYRSPGLDADYCDNHSLPCPSPDCTCPDCRATEAARQAEGCQFPATVRVETDYGLYALCSDCHDHGHMLIGGARIVGHYAPADGHACQCEHVAHIDSREEVTRGE